MPTLVSAVLEGVGAPSRILHQGRSDHACAEALTMNASDQTGPILLVRSPGLDRLLDGFLISALVECLPHERARVGYHRELVKPLRVFGNRRAPSGGVFFEPAPQVGMLFGGRFPVDVTVRAMKLQGAVDLSSLEFVHRKRWPHFMPVGARRWKRLQVSHGVRWLSAACLNISVRRATGTAPELMMSASTNDRAFCGEISKRRFVPTMSGLGRRSTARRYR